MRPASRGACLVRMRDLSSGKQLWRSGMARNHHHRLRLRHRRHRTCRSHRVNRPHRGYRGNLTLQPNLRGHQTHPCSPHQGSWSFRHPRRGRRRRRRRLRRCRWRRRCRVARRRRPPLRHPLPLQAHPRRPHHRRRRRRRRRRRSPCVPRGPCQARTAVCTSRPPKRAPSTTAWCRI